MWLWWGRRRPRPRWEEVPGTTIRELRKFRTTSEGKSVDVGFHFGEPKQWSWAPGCGADGGVRIEAGAQIRRAASGPLGGASWIGGRIAQVRSESRSETRLASAPSARMCTSNSVPPD